VCYVRYDKFLSHGKLLSHEEARKRGDLEMFDDFDELKAFNEAYPTIFISHQWLGWTEPDPENVHYEAIAKAVDQLFQMRLASRGREAVPETTHIYLWVDYLSIPQQNKVLQQLSISSLSVYSSICRFFIMVAPPARHVDADNNCSAETYQKRGWCRLEQMARMSIGGLHHLYLYGVAEGSTTVSLTPIADLSPVVEDPSYSMMRPATQEGSQERASTSTIRMLAHRRAWYRDSIRVYQGNFTVDADKSKLVDTMLSFWGYLLKNRHSSGGHQELYELVEEHKEEVFPKEYFGDLIQLLELLMEAESVLNESSRSGRLGTVAADARHTTRQTTRQTTRRSPGDLGNHERHLARWRMRRHHYMAGGIEVERRQSAASLSASDSRTTSLALYSRELASGSRAWWRLSSSRSAGPSQRDPRASRRSCRPLSRFGIMSRASTLGAPRWSARAPTPMLRTTPPPPPAPPAPPPPPPPPAGATTASAR